jgi:hypothetical protein
MGREFPARLSPDQIENRNPHLRPMAAGTSARKNLWITYLPANPEAAGFSQAVAASHDSLDAAGVLPIWGAVLEGASRIHRR